MYFTSPSAIQPPIHRRYEKEERENTNDLTPFILCMKCSRFSSDGNSFSATWTIMATLTAARLRTNTPTVVKK